jgi:hypothetical protein
MLIYRAFFAALRHFARSCSIAALQRFAWVEQEQKQIK